MVIRIIKKGTRPAAPPAPAPAPVAPPPPIPSPAPSTSPAAALKAWKGRVPPPGAKPRLCPYCEHEYIMPCDDKQHSSCENWKHLQSMKKAAAS